MNELDNIHPLAAAPHDADGAVGVPKKQWFVAIVNNNTERAVAQRLEQQGIPCYVAAQQTVRVWKNGRRAKVNRVVIPAAVFVYVTEQQRRQIVALPYINRFMVNRAARLTRAGTRQLAVIPDREIQTLRFMLGQTDTCVNITAPPLHVGDAVQVIRGSLTGLVGHAEELTPGKSDLIVSLDILGCARLTIDTLNLKPLS